MANETEIVIALRAVRDPRKMDLRLPGRAADEIERLRTENEALIADNAKLLEGWTAEVNQ